jgi:hypothetical protein
MKKILLFILVLALLSASAFAMTSVLMPTRSLTVAPVNQTITTAPVVKTTPVTTAPIVQSAPLVTKSLVNYPASDNNGLETGYEEAPASNGSLDIVTKTTRTETEYDLDYDEPGSIYGVRCSADDCTYHYDEKGMVIGVTEKTTSNESPDKVKERTRVIVYDTLGRIEKEITADHEQGIPGEVLDEVQGLGPVYQAMYELLRQGQEQKKDELQEMKASAEQKLQAALDSVEQKKEEIEESKEEANFFQRSWMSIKSLFMMHAMQDKLKNDTARIESDESKQEDMAKCRQLHEKQRRAVINCSGVQEMKDNNLTYYFNMKGKLTGYKEDGKTTAKTHIFEYDEMGQIEEETVIDHETGNMTDRQALEDQLGNTDIDALVELVMFEAQQSEDDSLRETIEELQRLNKQKSAQREYQEYLKDQKEKVNGQIQDEYDKQNQFYNEPASEIAEKLPGTLNDTAKKGVKLGEGATTEPQGRINDLMNKSPAEGRGMADRPGFITRFWGWLTGERRGGAISTLSNMMMRKNSTTQDILVQNQK